MADVRAAKTAVAVEYPENKGTISAYTLVQAVGFNGLRVFKRVRIGVEFGVSVDNAKEMMKNIRSANSGEYGPVKTDIMGKFVMEM